MNKFALIAASAMTVATMGAGIAFAQDNSTDSAFIQADGNKDGTVSMEEAMGKYPTLDQTLFAQADANGDGTLDAGEFTQLEGLTAGLGAAAGFNTGTDSSSSNESSSSNDTSTSAEISTSAEVSIGG